MTRVLVTGAGSGFGRRTVARLAARGVSVLAADREAPDPALWGSDGANVTPIRIDLHDAGAVATTLAAVAEEPLDGVVHNAGYAVFNALPDADMDAISALFDANVLGTIRVMRGVLPAVRQARGTIVVVSSVAGRMVFPESGYYAAAKHALEALAEGWYVENAGAGVRVALIEPGAFDTGFGARATAASRPRPSGSVHQQEQPRWDARKAAMLEAPQDPDRVAAAIVGALESGPSFQRVVVGDDAARILAAREAVGEDAFVRCMGASFAGTPPEDPLTPEQVASLEAAGMVGPVGDRAHPTADPSER